MHAGDIFSGKNLPLLDTNNGGSGVDIADTLTKAHDSDQKNVDTIITGHSTQMTVADLREYSAFNREFLNGSQDGKKAGKAAEDSRRRGRSRRSTSGYAAPPARASRATSRW